MKVTYRETDLRKILIIEAETKEEGEQLNYFELATNTADIQTLASSKSPHPVLFVSKTH